MFLKNLLNFFEKYSSKKSYSQLGEDLILRFIFNQLGIINPNFIDIGAHHPIFLNNTYLFYKKGSRGINIEPDLDMFSKFKKLRKEDINLNLGIDVEEGVKDFYVINHSTLNTFSKIEAERYSKIGDYCIKKTVKIQVITFHQLIMKYCKDWEIDFLSIDVEGLDEQIIKSIDFSLTRPKVICVETISFETFGHGKRQTNIINHLNYNNYREIANTYVNSIFIDNLLFQ